MKCVVCDKEQMIHKMEFHTLIYERDQQGRVTWQSDEWLCKTHTKVEIRSYMAKMRKISTVLGGSPVRRLTVEELTKFQESQEEE